MAASELAPRAPRTRWRTGNGGAPAVPAGVAAYFLFPLAWLLAASTKSTTDLFGSGAFSLTHFSLFQNLVKVSTYDDGHFWRWYLNSVFYSGTTAVVGTLICALAGYALSKYRLRGGRVIWAVIVSSLVVP